MKLEDVNQSIIGHRVSCIENGYRVTGTITAIREDEYTVYVKIQFDKPLTCWSGDFATESWVETEYESWARKCDGWGNLQHTTIIDTLYWLADYMPADEHFTSQSEMDLIALNLGLECLTNEQLQEKRNEVVRFYHDLKVKNQEDRNKVWDLSTALMSVTAVIDHYKWNRGMEV